MSDPSSFADFVQQRKAGGYGKREGACYAYAADLAMLCGFSRVRPVKR